MITNGWQWLDANSQSFHNCLSVWECKLCCENLSQITGSWSWLELPAGNVHRCERCFKPANGPTSINFGLAPCTLILSLSFVSLYWGEPERAPHRWVCCGICLYIHIIYRTSCHKSLPALVLRVLVSFVISKLFTNYSMRRHEPPYLLDGNSKDGDHSWTYLFND